MLFKFEKIAYSDSEIEAKGRQDGANRIPALDSTEPTPYEIQLLQANRQMAGRVVEACQPRLEKIEGEIAQWKQYSIDYLGEIQHIKDQHRTEIEHCNNDPILRHAEQEKEIAERAYLNKYNQLNRKPLLYIPLWAYLIFAILIGIGEIPLNALVFNIFGENQIMTWVMSAIIGLCIPLSAHFVGIKVREHGDGFSLPNALKAAFVFVIITIALFALALMRQEYLGLLKDDIGLDDRVVDVSFMFFWLNIAVFVSAILVAYFAHDPVPGYAQLYRDNENAKKKSTKAQDDHRNDIKTIEEKKIQRTEAANQQKADAEKTIHRLEAEFDACLKAGQEQEERWQHQLGRDIACYRRENLLARKKSEEGKRPKSFEHGLKFKRRLSLIEPKTEKGPLHEENPKSDPEQTVDSGEDAGE